MAVEARPQYAIQARPCWPRRAAIRGPAKLKPSIWRANVRWGRRSRWCLRR